MSVLTELKKSGACMGGIAIYSGAKALALVANLQKKRRELGPNTRILMKPLFPLKLDGSRA